MNTVEIKKIHLCENDRVIITKYSGVYMEYMPLELLSEEDNKEEMLCSEIKKNSKRCTRKKFKI